MPNWPHDDLVHAWWVTPGAVLAGEYPTDWKGSSTKLETLLDAGIVTFIDLTTRRDPLRKYEPLLTRLAEERGVEARRASFPIPDMSVIEVDGYTEIIDFMSAEVAADRPVYVHCWGGIGRTGTVIGCWLVSHSRTTEEAVAEIAALRTGTRKERRRSPETEEQIRMIQRWELITTDGG